MIFFLNAINSHILLVIIFMELLVLILVIKLCFQCMYIYNTSGWFIYHCHTALNNPYTLHIIV